MLMLARYWAASRIVVFITPIWLAAVAYTPTLRAQIVIQHFALCAREFTTMHSTILRWRLAN